jgi:hypothetical protein
VKAADIQKLRKRDSHCWHCGTTENLVPHHRANRGMGGSKVLRYASKRHTRVCAALNYAMESDAEVAQEALENGWKLKSWDDFSKPVFDKMAAHLVALRQRRQQDRDYREQRSFLAL